MLSVARELPFPSFPQEGWEGPKNSLGSPCCMLCLPRGSPKPEADVLGTGVRQDWGSWCGVLCPAGAGQALLIRGEWDAQAPGDVWRQGFIHTLCRQSLLASLTGVLQE